MKDFLTFQTFITPSLLIFMYYVGAVLIPILSWYLARWIKTVYKTEIETYTTVKQKFMHTLPFLYFFSVWRYYGE